MTLKSMTERQQTEQPLLRRDLATLQTFARRMGDYLMSEATHWDLGLAGMPPLTIGGYLMRRRRLAALVEQLHTTERDVLRVANGVFDATARDHLVRFEARAQAEVGDRLREWTHYLRDLAGSKRLAADLKQYAYKADTRVVILELVEMLSVSPYYLPAHVPGDLAAVDRRLRARWESGAFIWDPVWQAAYPPDVCWWLYGRPATG
jgi:hypothetical protein